VEEREERHLQAQECVLDRDRELLRVVAGRADETGRDEDRDGKALPLRWRDEGQCVAIEEEEADARTNVMKIRPLTQRNWRVGMQ
jgi:hypothetical protein